MEPENLNPDTIQKSSLHSVTSLSKYLALALFIILPFVGGWVGYMYAPEKVVEVEKIVGVEKEVTETDVLTENLVDMFRVSSEKVDWLTLDWQVSQPVIDTFPQIGTYVIFEIVPATFDINEKEVVKVTIGDGFTLDKESYSFPVTEDAGSVRDVPLEENRLYKVVAKLKYQPQGFTCDPQVKGECTPVYSEEDNVLIQKADSYMYVSEPLYIKEVANLANTSTNNMIEGEGFQIESMTYSDYQAGFRFSYPSSWGRVDSVDEIPSQKYDHINNQYFKFDCVDEYDDPCNFRSYTFPEFGKATIFITAETIGHHENPVGRGGFWGDIAGDVTSDYLTECSTNQKCTTYTNPQGITFTKYEADPPPEERGYMPERYLVYNQNSQYYGIVLSSHRIDSFIEDDSNSTSDIFQKTIIDSFEFIQ